MRKNAILVVSFGTSYADTCAKTIGKIEEEIQEKYPEYEVYRAWTSGIIRRKIEKRDGIHTFSVEEALEQMKKDGVKKLVVQPTHVLNGIENDMMLDTVKAHAASFEKVSVGTPLFTSQEDIEEVLEVVVKELQPAEDETLVFMGHGSEHYVNTVYAAMNYILTAKGINNVVIGTVEGYPTIDDVVRELKIRNNKKVKLAPFMVVAGDHANNDLAGDEEDSWKSICEKEGYEVSCELKGLGEFAGVREVYLKHLKEAM